MDPQALVAAGALLLAVCVWIGFWILAMKKLFK